MEPVTLGSEVYHSTIYSTRRSKIYGEKQIDQTQEILIMKNSWKFGENISTVGEFWFLVLLNPLGLKYHDLKNPLRGT